MTEERRALALGAVALLALGLFVTFSLQVVTDIAHFLPDGAAAEDVHLARELASGELSRTMVVLVDAPDTETAARASRAFEAALRAEPRVGIELASLDAGPPPGIEEAMWEIYEPHRFAFLATDAASAEARLTPAALAEAAAHLKHRLSLPVSSFLSRVAPRDPLLILPALFERLMAGRGEGLRVFDGRFVTTDGTAAVLFLTTRSAASDGTAQRPFLEGLRAAFDGVDAEFGVSLELASSGANRFAVRAEQAIRADIQRVSIGSSIGLVLLLLVLFRSLRLMLLVLPVLATGFLAGTSACLLLFGSVHGLTLAFGTALVGVCIDYPVHFHCHHVFAPGAEGPRSTLRSIWPGLLLGAATTVVGFLALMLSSFPGLRQLAVFGAFGVGAALFATRAFLPGLAARQARSTAVSRRLVAGLRGTLEVAGRRRVWLALPAVIVAIVAACGLPAVRWSDGIADLNRLDPELLAAEAAVRARVVRYEQRRLVVAYGPDEETALQANDGAARVLEAAVRQSWLGGWRGIATLVPSARQQAEVDAVVRGDEALWTKTENALRSAGFHAEAFAPFRDALAASAPEPLRPASLRATPLEPLVRPFRVSLDEGVGFVSFLHELHDEAALRQALDEVPGARLIDIEGALNSAYGAYRQRMLELWLFGLLAVLALVAIRHRALRPTLIACAPAVLAAAGTVGLLALCGVTLNILSLVALLMVVSMGVDYGVFMAEAHGDRRQLDATHLAVFTAGVSTVMGFGLLGFSDQPPLRSIGLTSGVGLLLCLVLAPTLCALAAPRVRR